MNGATTMTVEEAIALTEWRRRHWTLLVYEVHDGRSCPRYACSSCWLQHLTLVSEGARLPDRCPRCGSLQQTP